MSYTFLRDSDQNNHHIVISYIAKDAVFLYSLIARNLNGTFSKNVEVGELAPSILVTMRYRLPKR